MRELGQVYLVGAGPGAADLITVRGAKLLARADIVFYDALVSPEMLEFCPQAQKVLVGKRCGKLSTAQRFIEKRMIDAAHKYACVVRLKGGDPMMFGRADEEIQALKQAQIKIEVVPGVTAALAAAASLQQSLTLRGVARSVAFVTKARGVDERNLSGTHTVADLPIEHPQADTLVYYMGRRDATLIGNELIAQGRPLATPVTVIQAVSTQDERSIALSLREMACGDLDSWFEDDLPVLVLIGQALAHSERQQRSNEITKELRDAFSSHAQNRLQDLEIFSDGRLSA